MNNNIIKIKEYLNNPLFNPSFDNQYCLRYSLQHNQPEIAMLLLNNFYVKNYINEDWIKNCIRTTEEKNVLHFIENIKNF